MAMLTVACMRFLSAALNAVRISGAAEIAATTTAVTAIGAPLSRSPSAMKADMNSASRPMMTTPTRMVAIEVAADSSGPGSSGLYFFRSERG